LKKLFGKILALLIATSQLVYGELILKPNYSTELYTQHITEIRSKASPNAWFQPSGKLGNGRFSEPSIRTLGRAIGDVFTGKKISVNPKTTYTSGNLNFFVLQRVLEDMREKPRDLHNSTSWLQKLITEQVEGLKGVLESYATSLEARGEDIYKYLTHLKINEFIRTNTCGSNTISQVQTSNKSPVSPQSITMSSPGQPTPMSNPDSSCWINAAVQAVLSIKPWYDFIQTFDANKVKFQDPRIQALYNDKPLYNAVVQMPLAGIHAQINALTSAEPFKGTLLPEVVQIGKEWYLNNQDDWRQIAHEFTQEVKGNLIIAQALKKLNRTGSSNELDGIQINQLTNIPLAINVTLALKKFMSTGTISAGQQTLRQLLFNGEAGVGDAAELFGKVIAALAPISEEIQEAYLEESATSYCSSKSHPSVVNDPPLSSIIVHRESSIENSLNTHYFTQAALNDYFCHYCGAKGLGHKTTTLARLGSVLAISATKVLGPQASQVPVTAPATLDMRPYMSQDLLQKIQKDGHSTQYDLTAVLLTSGSTDINGKSNPGHWFAWINRGGQGYMCDDSSIVPMPYADSSFAPYATLMVYTRKY
jgi:ubiquitin C-terminal hydrolase